MAALSPLLSDISAFPCADDINAECARIAAIEKLPLVPHRPHICSKETCVIRRAFLDMFLCVTQSKIAHVCGRDEHQCPLYMDSGNKFRCRFSDDEVAVNNLSADEHREMIRVAIAKRRAAFSQLHGKNLSRFSDAWGDYNNKAQEIWQKLMYSPERDAVDATRRSTVMACHVMSTVTNMNNVFRKARVALRTPTREQSPFSPVTDRKRIAADAFVGDGQSIIVDAFLNVVVAAAHDVRLYVLTSKETREDRDEKYRVCDVVIWESYRYFALVQARNRANSRGNRDASVLGAVADKSDKQYTIQDHLLAWCYARDKTLVNTECVSQRRQFPLGLDLMLPHPMDLSSLGMTGTTDSMSHFRTGLSLLGVQSFTEPMN